MRRILIAAALAFAGLCASGCETTPAPAALIDRTEVMTVARTLADRYASTWNAGDMTAFGALYLPDARHVNMSGEFLRGRNTIVDVHRRNRTSYPSSVRMIAQLEGARAITEDAIVAVVRLEIVNDPARPGGVSPSRVKTEWKIAQAHAYGESASPSSPTPAGSAPPPRG
ncbi:MAG: hypothetical protein FD124_373 [Alphaproteobacteria bacterium]|nr:MAG: hypothetical protein FD124_373 [Alphaproteobacteria bacterium]